MNTASTFVQEKLREGKKPNRLINEKSPYLLQHAFNPVDWYPWGDDAFKRARDEDKPIFLSVGYSTCYWCHVMEREDFENDSIARLMNDHFVCIKVDREERPDVDRVYMSAVQAISGGGGWPMSVFLTPDLKPFFAGTYFPPEPSMGRPGFPQILEHIAEVWKNERSKVVESSKGIAAYLQERAHPPNPAALNDSTLEKAYLQLRQSFDTAYAGFGSAPKFPQPVAFNFLLRYYARTGNDTALQMTLKTLRTMAEGGVYDHIGGGFHRYSVDAQWRVPHFEKMLYDQAQLAMAYLEAYQVTHDAFFASVARDIFDYVFQNMISPEGGFYSAEDAESLPASRTHAKEPGHSSPPHGAKPGEKEEGAYYLWTASEIETILGPEEAKVFNYYYGISDSGNALHDPMRVFVGKNILYVAHPIDETATGFNRNSQEIRALLLDAREKLRGEREHRPRPHLDDKVITAWNGLMISALATAYQILGDPGYLDAARRAATFVSSKLYDRRRQKLLRRYRDGEARFEGTLQDYAFVIKAMLDLYEASFDIQWLDLAINLSNTQTATFQDSSGGGFFDTAAGDSSLIVRTKDDYDGAEPTGNSVAALNLLRLSQITDNKEWRTAAEKTVAAFGSRLQQYPPALAQMLVALDWMLSTPKEIVVASRPGGTDTQELLKEIHSHFIPNKVLLLADGSDGQKRLASFLPFIVGMTAREGRATAYICENYACQLPTSDRQVIAQILSNKKAALK